MFIGEFEFSKGEFIALSPKCYYTESANGDVKLGTKGLPHHVKVKIENFRKSLYDGEAYEVELQTLTRKNNQMSRVKMVKSGLSRVFVKFPVQNDSITCTPLQKENTYL